MLKQKVLCNVSVCNRASPVSAGVRRTSQSCGYVSCDSGISTAKVEERRGNWPFLQPSEAVDTTVVKIWASRLCS